jgi:hypothetical protein
MPKRRSFALTRPLGVAMSMPMSALTGGAFATARALHAFGDDVSIGRHETRGEYSAQRGERRVFSDVCRVEIDDVDKAPVALTLTQPAAVNMPLPTVARNYMDKEPKLPTPHIDPYRVALPFPRPQRSRRVTSRAGCAASNDGDPT